MSGEDCGISEGTVGVRRRLWGYQKWTLGYQEGRWRIRKGLRVQDVDVGCQKGLWGVRKELWGLSQEGAVGCQEGTVGMSGGCCGVSAVECEVQEGAVRCQEGDVRSQEGVVGCIVSERTVWCQEGAVGYQKWTVDVRRGCEMSERDVGVRRGLWVS